MKLMELIRIDELSAGKVGAVLAFVCGLFASLFSFSYRMPISNYYGMMPFMGYMMGGWAVPFSPFIAIFFVIGFVIYGFVLGLILAFVYNLIAKSIGGLKIELK